MQQLSAAVTSRAQGMDAEFPFVTMPRYEIAAGYADGLGGIMFAAFAPLVTSDQRIEWETYAQQNVDWIDESERLRQVHPSHRDPLHGTIQDHEHDRRRLLSSVTGSIGESVSNLQQVGDAQSRGVQEDAAPEEPRIAPKIWHWENGTRVVSPTQPDQLYAPLWQVSPPGLDLNVDMLADERVMRLYQAMLITKGSVLSNDFPITDLFDFLFDPEEKPLKDAPHAFLMEPVYTRFEEEPKLAGFLVGVTVWKNLFNQLLPEGAVGVIAVVDDACGGQMTFRMDGPVSTFLGHGDLHDPGFDQFRRTTDVELYDWDVIGNATDGLLCPHTLHIYPTVEFQDSYKTVRFYYCIFVCVMSLLMQSSVCQSFALSLTHSLTCALLHFQNNYRTNRSFTRWSWRWRSC